MLNDTTLKLRVTERAVERWKKAAVESGCTLSEWIRRRCDGGLVLGEKAEEVSKPQNVPFKADHPASERRGRVRYGKAVAGKCPHHKERMELCYKCDPKFGNPVIHHES
jgi:hypothetical protein